MTPRRWTKEARQAVESMVVAGKSRETIERVVGLPWRIISRTLAYHARQDALARKRATDPRYADIVVPEVVVEDKTEELYKPKVALPARLRKYAGKTYG